MHGAQKRAAAVTIREAAALRVNADSISSPAGRHLYQKASVSLPGPPPSKQRDPWSTTHGSVQNMEAGGAQQSSVPSVSVQASGLWSGYIDRSGSYAATRARRASLYICYLIL